MGTHSASQHYFYFDDGEYNLGPDSHKRLSTLAVNSVTSCYKDRSKNQLIRWTTNEENRLVFMPTSGFSGPMDIYSCELILTLPREAEGNITKIINDALLDLDNFPFLKLAIGKIPKVGNLTHLTFSAANIVLKKNKTAHRCFAREGDQIWQVEQIGKVGKDIVHVMGLFLADPFRSNLSNPGDGWLIHEERTKLDV